MNSESDKLLGQIEKLNTYRRGDRRAPHKPLLLLLALGNLKSGKERLSFSEVEAKLLPLLNAYAPPVVARHQPELPFWYLQSDGLWLVEGAEDLPRQRSGFPRLPALRETYGHFLADVAHVLRTQEGLLETVVRMLLNEHFPHSLHEDILAATGIELTDGVPLSVVQQAVRPRRDPQFRDKVLLAYEHRCAVTGFRAALQGNYFGCEAAHVQWHAYDGPDIVANGLCLEPTLHKLFDAGAWTLSDDHRVLVSAEFTGSDSAVHRLRERHGQPISTPIHGDQVSVEFIQWHREPELGGVFREPALD